MQALARELPDRITSLSAMARDLTASTARRARQGLDRAQDLGGDLQHRFDDLVDRKTRRAIAHGARREFDRARDAGDVLRQRLEAALGRERRPSRLPVALSIAVVGVAVGGALLSSPKVRAGLGRGWDLLRRRLAQPQPAPAASVAPQPQQERQEDILDGAIEDSFPASDPVGVQRFN